MSPTTILLVLMISGFATAKSKAQVSTQVYDLFMKALIKTVQTPISASDSDTKLSTDIILQNDVFTLDDILRLCIQQFLIALYNGRPDLLPENWETEYPQYSKIIQELNQVLDLIGDKTLGRITIKDLRPLIKSFTPKAFDDLQQLIKAIDEKIKEEKSSSNGSSKQDL